MAEIRQEGTEVNARILYWGIDGAGKTANVRTIFEKLRPDHRGRLRVVPTRLDPTVTYEVLPIELGEIAGVRTRIDVIAVPGAPQHGPTRKQLLDQVDGVVFVVDPDPARIEDNVGALEELRKALAAYGRSLEETPLVIQYNKRDRADAYALEALHRKLDLRGVAAYEAVATDGTAVLQTLTTISKRVIRALRERGLAPAAEPAPFPDPVPTPEHLEPESEAPLLAEEPAPLPPSDAVATPVAVAAAPPVAIAAVGPATQSDDHTLRLPLVLRDGRGEEHRVALVLRLEAEREEEPR